MMGAKEDALRDEIPLIRIDLGSKIIDRSLEKKERDQRKSEITATTIDQKILVQFAANWIYSNFEDDDESTLSRDEFYDQYVQYCKANETTALNLISLSITLRSIYPAIKIERLSETALSVFVKGLKIRKEVLVDANETVAVRLASIRKNSLAQDKSPMP